MLKHLGSFAILVGITANVTPAAAAVDTCEQVTFHISGILSDATAGMYGAEGSIVSDERAFSNVSLPLALEDYGLDVRLGRTSDRTWRVDVRQRVGKEEAEPFQGPATNIEFDEKGSLVGIPPRFVFQPMSGDVRASNSTFWVVFDGLQLGPTGSAISVDRVERADHKCVNFGGVVDKEYPSGPAIVTPLDEVERKEFLKSQE